MDHEVTVELKNDIQIRGTLKSVDQYLNIKLDDISVVEEVKYPHLVSDVQSQFRVCTGKRDWQYRHFVRSGEWTGGRLLHNNGKK